MDVANLFFAYLRVRPPRRQLTLLEIVKQADKELVWSRLLAHFLDPTKGHGLSSLFLTALTTHAGQTLLDESVRAVETETITANGKFIDLVITTDKRVIIIENKLYAAAFNDFEEYRREGNSRATSVKLVPLFILLSLNPLDRSKNGFQTVTWGALRREIVRCAGFLLAQPANHHTFYLQEFLSMVANACDGHRVDEAFIDFVATHKDEISSLLFNLDAVKKHLSILSNEFGAAVLTARNGRGPKPLQYRESQPSKLFAITYFDLVAENGAIIAVDVAFEPSGVRVEIFCRTRKHIVDFLPRFQKAGILLRDLEDDGRHEWSRTFSRKTDPTEVVAEVCSLLDSIYSNVLPESQTT